MVSDFMKKFWLVWPFLRTIFFELCFDMVLAAGLNYDVLFGDIQVPTSSVFLATTC